MDDRQSFIKKKNRDLALQTLRTYARILKGETIGAATLKNLGIEEENDRENIANIIKEIAETEKITEVYAAGTQALRDVIGTEKGNSFIREVGQALGHSVKVISGQMEAEFQGHAVLVRDRRTEGTCMFGGMGGGSMQFGVLENGIVGSKVSLRKGEYSSQNPDEIKELFESHLRPVKPRHVDMFHAVGSEWRYVARVLVYRRERAKAEEAARKKAPKKANESEIAALAKVAADKISFKDIEIHKEKLEWKEIKSELLKLSQESPAYFRQKNMSPQIKKRAAHLAFAARTLYETLDIVRPATVVIPGASMRDGIAYQSQRNQDFKSYWQDGLFGPQPT